MSLGNTYDNNKSSNGVFDPTVYSAYKMNNAEGIVDQTCLSFHYWNNMLKISIAPKKSVNADGSVVFDYQGSISIYLNHTKARIFAEEIKNFLRDPVAYDNSGVPSGQGLILISRGTEFNSPAPIITIRKVDENGRVISSFAYQTKTDFNFSVRNYNENGNFEKCTEDYKDLEILQIITVLEEFYKAATSAVAYTVLDAFKYEHKYQKEWRNAVSSKLGIDIPGSGNSGRSYSSTSYFNNSPGVRSNSTPSNTGMNTGYTRATLDDID